VTLLESLQVYFRRIQFPTDYFDTFTDATLDVITGKTTLEDSLLLRADQVLWFSLCHGWDWEDVAEEYIHSSKIDRTGIARS